MGDVQKWAVRQHLKGTCCLHLQRYRYTLAKTTVICDTKITEHKSFKHATSEFIILYLLGTKSIFHANESILLKL